MSLVKVFIFKKLSNNLVAKFTNLHHIELEENMTLCSGKAACDLGKL